jgi:peptidoglycan/LPS O-acetylase OafA/YrhL
MRSPAPVTTTDLLKLAGLAFVFADHFGLFFTPDDEWWRLAGRTAAPIFFFLIGFAGTRNVPSSWIILGAMLTALDVYVSGGLEDVTLNILFSFALIRLVSPWIKAHIMPSRWGLPALALVCAAINPLVEIILEYGAEGWLWALFGLAAREAVVSGTPEARMQRNLVAAICVAAYLFVEARDFEFEPGQSAVLAIMICGLALTLIHFRREDAPFRAPAPIGIALNWIGRHSLEIYAVSLFLMQLTGHLFEDDAGGGHDA